MTIIWKLTVILVPALLELIDPNPYRSERDCRDEGIRQVQDYQQGGVRAWYQCEPQDHFDSKEQA